jgi:hypothetical protein
VRRAVTHDNSARTSNGGVALPATPPTALRAFRLPALPFRARLLGRATRKPEIAPRVHRDYSWTPRRERLIESDRGSGPPMRVSHRFLTTTGASEDEAINGSSS